MRFLISAGEASGDMYGAQLIEALRRQQPSAEFFGVDGEKMRATGCDAVVDARHLAVVGITEILSHLPKIYREFRKLMRAAAQRCPDAAIVIDSPAFNLRVAREMHRRNVPVIYYVSPQFWAWRQGRVRLIRRYFRKALVIFPFEEKFYRDRGVDAEFVGHPLADLSKPAISRAEFAAQNGLDPAKPWIAMLPGSRRKEVVMNLPEMLKAAEQLGSGYEFVLPVASTLDAKRIRSLIAPSRAAIHLAGASLPALVHARAAVVASGTATVEAALMGTPFVMVYRVTRMSYRLGRHLVKVPHFAMVNLIAGEEVVPELVQSEFCAENILEHLQKIIPEGAPREKMLAGLAGVRQKLRSDGSTGQSAADRAARSILKALGRPAESAAAELHLKR